MSSKSGFFGLTFGMDAQRGFHVERFGRPLLSLGGNWWPTIKEYTPGSWQRNMSIKVETSLEHFAVYACINRIASDIAKCPAFISRKKGQILERVVVPLYQRVLTKPNNYQNWTQFCRQWMVSKLTSGNTYVWKRRDASGRVAALYILNPYRVTVLVADDGSVYYELRLDRLNGREGETITVPSEDISHDRCVELFHPLVGVAPLISYCYAAGLGLEIQKHSGTFFTNAARPGGIITIPRNISDEQARQLKEMYETSFRGENAGRISILSDGAMYQAINESAADSQLIEQLKLSADIVCAAFSVPKYFVLGVEPPASAIETQLQSYYSLCLQAHVEALEHLLDDALEVDTNVYSVELDLDYLLRMDTSSRYKGYNEAIKGGWMKPNEARRREGMEDVPGGDSCYLQQQNYSLDALAKRDAQEDPFATGAPTPTPSPNDPGNPATTEDTEEEEQAQQEQEVARGIDGVDVQQSDDGRSLSMVFKFTDGTQQDHQLTLPGFVDKGVYNLDQTYTKGDTVSHGGSAWFAQRTVEANEEPGSSDAWRLAVKRGRDAKSTKGGA